MENLTPAERLILTGLQAREREIQRLYLDPLVADFAIARALIEERLGLTPGAITTTHLIDFERMALVAGPRPTAETADEDEYADD